MKHKNLILIGTSHIAKQSLEEVEKAILEEKPDIIALELDKKRFFALQYKGKKTLPPIRKVGFQGVLFSLIGAWAEKKLGKIVGMEPGDEMRKAIKLAKEQRILIALVDQDIEITLKKVSKAITWKEKWNFIKDLAKGLLKGGKKLPFDLRTVPNAETINKMMEEFIQKYPNLYKVLVKDRNKLMAKRLAKLMTAHPDKKILGIIGAGHEEEIIDLVKKDI